VPQLAIEYSGNLEGQFAPRALALAVHQALVETVATDLDNCKTRIRRLEEAVIASGGADEAMVHLDLRILSGRSDAQKQALGEAAMALLRDAVGEPEGLRVQLTVEVRELDRPHYRKQVVDRRAPRP
jgi:5-carboxymethyl-2-hydroxymuconate isomerase